MENKSFYWVPIKATCPKCKGDVYGESGGEIIASQLNELLATVPLVPLVCPKCLLPIPENVRRAASPQIVSEEKFRTRKLHNKQQYNVIKIPDEVN